MMNSNSMFFFVNVKVTPKENLMSQSMYVISPRRKKHPELTPVPPRDQRDSSRESWTTLTTSRSKDSSSYKLGDNLEVKSNGGPKRAVSMTRLDQLAKPRQRYLEESLKLRSLASEPRIRNGMSTSMTQLSNESFVVKTSANNINSNRTRWMSNANCLSDGDQQLSPSSRVLSKSMVTIGPRLPRETRLQKSRLSKGARRSLDDNSSSRTGPVSPTRPTSSLSGHSEQSTTSSLVVRRPKTCRKPRPVSIAGCLPDNHNRSTERQVNCSSTPKTANVSSITATPTIGSVHRPNRARSAGSKFRAPLDGSDNHENDSNQVKPAPPRKPAHVKAAAAARRNAKNQQPQVTQQLPQQQQQQVANKSEKSSSMDPNDRSKEVNEKRDSLEHLGNKEVINGNNKDESSKIANKLEEESDETGGNNTESETSMNQASSMTSSTSSKKEISEEEYKKILAEKRRLAREQAEKEAELERQRQEEANRAEEERQRAEEERIRAEEEEQIRLAEEHRRSQEEKLRQAMEEQRRREEEERKRREEEARLKAEREEQEVKAKEEAERARLELEERLRKDEEERMLRKKRVEAIMSRTRKAQGNKGNSDGSRTPDSNDSSPVRSIEESKGVSFNNQSIYLDVL